ncbi:hypothetical protein [Paenibacillus radicis (ex Gao et al. 2016)]|uniref:Uncharacterized protein n=1 Tax=Paenibacillus radicis (ex Gao et al. 2016) TaxID=1737354 RepID=A0A917M8L4_9BACL|nr:hypothetical protein [Paenibacillus radicis (ex Gao et al. 2016)]GGG82148.1 hypothetical protein GCM10010918_44380 [Paenibacillus radicis (ex Gao et al. 2016)]
MKNLYVLLLVLVLSACSNESVNKIDEPERGGGGQGEQASPAPAFIESRMGDFVLRLDTGKSIYGTEDAVAIRALLKYDGDKESETIYHAMYPVAFGVTELTRGIDFGYSMEDPLITTEMQKGMWLELPYKKTAGYIDSDSQAAFIEAFLKGDTFPAGEYNIKALADFYTEAGGKKTDYQFSADKQISVH